VLPLAVGGALVLLLSSLSLQTLALQSRAQAGANERLRRAEDDLASAAHHLVGDLNEGHPCLLSEPIGAWSPEAAACPAPAALSEERSVGDPAVSYRLIDWQPVAAGTVAELVLELPAQMREPARRGAFAVRLEAVGAGELRAVELRPLGLRGVER
jgi:hypothetical protein